ncbi:hypothetical protein HOLleu_02489 [Holothuria leucospilota]|uniref:C17orf113 probable zinc finger domain-containing protein n=1 Tax=Holothuria leucospilota TaxID=206669 RepID=A0A9Q1HLD2_HOLLE|nr:hypothetical protein HOLleu_02489 [Holothuria leucospilota]
MWRYCSSIKEPEKKRKRTQEDQSKYEDRRQRKFQETWLTNPAFKLWLRYDAEKGLMFCKCCEKHGPAEQVFVQGCRSNRIESLQKHVASRCHIKAVEMEKALSSQPGTSPAEQMLGKMNALAMAKLDILFRNAHALAKRHRPFTDFVWMCQLDEIKGLEIGKTYRTDKKCREFVEAIGEVERSTLESRMKDAKFFSIICDEATDSAILEQLIIYVR